MPPFFTYSCYLKCWKYHWYELCWPLWAIICSLYMAGRHGRRFWCCRCHHRKGSCQRTPQWYDCLSYWWLSIYPEFWLWGYHSLWRRYLCRLPLFWNICEGKGSLSIWLWSVLYYLWCTGCTWHVFSASRTCKGRSFQNRYLKCYLRYYKHRRCGR